MKLQKKKLIIILPIILLIVGFFIWQEYKKARVEKQYSDCMIECDIEAREILSSYERDEITEEIVSEIDSKFEPCIGVCVEDYKKITGKEKVPLYRQIKASMQNTNQE